ncbi:MAG: hypothetical protein AAFN10_20585 [Bacteroidota bacterium]
MKSKQIISLWVILLVLGGKGLAQTSSDTPEQKPAPFYAIVELGTGFDANFHCRYPEFVSNLGLGLRLGPHFGLGINHHFTAGVSRWSYYDFRLRGLSLHAFYRWRQWRLTAQAGKVNHYEDGCNREVSGFYFSMNQQGFNPYFRLSASFHPNRFLYFWLAYLQTPYLQGNFTYFSSSAYGRGLAPFRAKSAQFGVGWYFGR